MDTEDRRKDLESRRGGGCPPGFVSSCPLRDPHGFDIHEFADAVGCELAAMARTFYAAEGDARVGGDHFVDEDHAGLEFVDEAFALAVVAGPGAGDVYKRQPCARGTSHYTNAAGHR